MSSSQGAAAHEEHGRERGGERAVDDCLQHAVPCTADHEADKCPHAADCGQSEGNLNPLGQNSVGPLEVDRSFQT
jgi:hypothetical protein